MSTHVVIWVIDSHGAMVRLVSITFYTFDQLRWVQAGLTQTPDEIEVKI